MTDPVTAAAVLDFWFGIELDDPAAIEARNRVWFTADPDFDADVSARFAGLLSRAGAGALSAWSAEPRSSLALVITLDQFPRNVSRGTPQAFARDALALAECSAGIDRGHDLTLHPVEALFYYMPLQHAEDRAVQARSCELTEALAARCPAPVRPFIENSARYARTHRDIIERFGRFPHRNALLEREPSAEERAWLAAGGETFGQS